MRILLGFKTVTTNPIVQYNSASKMSIPIVAISEHPFGVIVSHIESQVNPVP